MSFEIARRFIDGKWKTGAVTEDAGGGLTPEGAVNLYVFTKTFTAVQLAEVWDAENTQAASASCSTTTWRNR